MFGKELLLDGIVVPAKGGDLIPASSKLLELAIEPGPVPKFITLADLDIESCGKLAPLVNPVSAIRLCWVESSFNLLVDSPSLTLSNKSDVSIAFFTPSSRSRRCYSWRLNYEGRLGAIVLALDYIVLFIVDLVALPSRYCEEDWLFLCFAEAVMALRLGSLILNDLL